MTGEIEWTDLPVGELPPRSQGLFIELRPQRPVDVEPVGNEQDDAAAEIAVPVASNLPTKAMEDRSVQRTEMVSLSSEVERRREAVNAIERLNRTAVRASKAAGLIALISAVALILDVPYAAGPWVVSLVALLAAGVTVAYVDAPVSSFVTTQGRVRVRPSRAMTRRSLRTAMLQDSLTRLAEAGAIIPSSEADDRQLRWFERCGLMTMMTLLTILGVSLGVALTPTPEPSTSRCDASFRIPYTHGEQVTFDWNYLHQKTNTLGYRVGGWVLEGSMTVTETSGTVTTQRVICDYQ